MDVTIDEIAEQLDEFCMSVQDEEILRKLKELCFVYHCSAEDIVAEWVSYCVSKTVKKECIPPTLQLLDQLDKEKEMSSKTSKSRKSQSVSTPVYNSKTISSEHFQSPTMDNRRNLSLDKSPQFSPSSMTPSGYTPSRKYGSRNNAGDVCLSFGSANVEWMHSDEIFCSITAFKESVALQKPYNYMCEKLRDYASILNDMIQDAAKLFEEKNNIEDWGHIQLPSMETVPVVGRICSDNTGRLSASSLLLEGSQETSSGQCIPLDVSSLKQFSFFPGQIIAGTGVNNLGKKFILKSLFEGLYPPVSSKAPDLANCNDLRLPPSLILRVRCPNPPDVYLEKVTFLESLSVVIAAGPFATSDTFSYEPLFDLLKYIKSHQPHVVILIGPFVDIKNELIENGDVNEIYEEVFKRITSEIVKSIDHANTRVLLVPSSRDAHHDCIYPTPPYSLSCTSRILQVASDPCVVNIEGVIFAISATDILFHMGKEEISHGQMPDRLGRLCSHILTQRHFYPLYPPNEEVNIEYLHYEANAGLPVMPHVLLLPSDFRYFIKDVNGCCCINPERLTKHSSGGTFARMKINRIDEKIYAEKHSIIDYVKAEIVKI